MIALLSPLDWFIFFAILVITLISVVYGSSIKKNINGQKASYLELILMGRQLTLPLFVATLVATWYGGIFGVTKMAFEKGIYNFLTQGVFWYFTYIIFAIFFVERIRKSEALTLPDLIRKEFGPKSQKIAAILNLLNVIPITYAISVGLLLNIIFGLSLPMGTFLGVTFVLLYSTTGGLRAVVFSDVVQFSIMILAVLLVLLFSYFEFGGLSYLTENLPRTHLEISGGQSFWTTLMWGVIALSTLVDPNFYQRCLAAKNSATAKKGIFISTSIWIFFDLCTTLGALYARASSPELPPETAYLTYALTILPNGFKGVLLAGVFATIVSTLDSYIFLGATTIVNDLFEKYIKRKILAHHISALAMGFIAIAFSILFNGNILKVWKLLGGMSSSCLLIPVVVGRLFKNKINDQQFFQSSLTGIMSILIWNVMNLNTRWFAIDDLYIGCIGSLSVLGLALIKNPTPA